jgi:tetratricopeptide (TPR) repeat protein
VPLRPLKQLLTERADGNPFFIEENVRTMVETGVLVGERGSYHLVKAVPSVRAPATVQAVLAARIDRLPLEEKRLLLTAAVIGTEVPFALLDAIAELPGGKLRVCLSHLQGAEFLYETQLFPELAYTFKHALTHEVTYGSLLQGRRRALHARVVGAMERLYPDRLDDHVDRLAHHAWEGEQWDKAVTYCRQAGDKADDWAAFREAVNAFERAIEALRHQPETPDTRRLAVELRHDLEEVLLPMGEHGRSRIVLEEAETLARHLNDRAQLIQVLAMLATVRRMQGDLDGAVAVCRQAYELAADLGDRTLQAATSHRLGQVYGALGDFGCTAQLLQRNVVELESSTAAPDPYYRIASRAWLALVLGALGKFTEGIRYGEEALRLATPDGRWDTPIVVHGCLGLLYLGKGDLEHAVHVLDNGLALCRAISDRDWSRSIAAGLGYAHALAGRLAEGRALLEEALGEGLRTGAIQAHAIQVAWLSEVYLLAGRRDEAWHQAWKALDFARQ